MNKMLLPLALLASTMAAQAQANDAEIQKYCEDASIVMQIGEADKAAYIAECIENRKAELSEGE